MKTLIKKDFDVDQEVKKVWAFLLQPELVVDCVPGVSIDEKIAEGRYKGFVGMKFGPIQANYDAEIIYDDINEDNQTIKLMGKGVDTKGMGSAEMQLTLRLEPTDDGCHVDSDMEIIINGKIAQFGSRLIQNVSNQLFEQFVANFTKILKGYEISEKDKNVSAGGVLKTVFKGMFNNSNQEKGKASEKK